LSPFIEFLRVTDLPLNTDILANDLSAPLHYHADIPIGYGMGSSGALTAAFFDRYYIKKSALSLEELKAVFQQIESFFHGSSSGIDPLVSYLNSPIRVDENKQIELIDTSFTAGTFYLVDTGISRSTAPLVELFKKKQKDSQFAAAVAELTILNNKAIAAYLNNDSGIALLVTEISKIQQKHFSEMIPDIIKERVERYNLKLCGAGGGGFFLGYCRNEEKEVIREELNPLFLK
jgi:mevalonate kinase